METPGFVHKDILHHYLTLDQPKDTIQYMYVWIDGTGEHLRAKSRTLNFEAKGPKGNSLFCLFDTLIMS